MSFCSQQRQILKDKSDKQTLQPLGWAGQVADPTPAITALLAETRGFPPEVGDGNNRNIPTSVPEGPASSAQQCFHCKQEPAGLRGVRGRRPGPAGALLLAPTSEAAGEGFSGVQPMMDSPFEDARGCWDCRRGSLPTRLQFTSTGREAGSHSKEKINAVYFGPAATTPPHPRVQCQPPFSHFRSRV